MLLAVVGHQDFEHVDHAALFVVGGGFQGQLERGRYPKVECVGFGFFESQGSPADVCAITLF